MLILEHVERKEKKSRGLNGVGYCPFLVLGRDTAVVSRQEGRFAHDKHACAHDKPAARAAAHTRHGAGRTTEGLCRDRGVSFARGDGVFHVTKWSTMSRHGSSATRGCCVAIGKAVS